MAAEKGPPPKRRLTFNIVYFIFVLFSVLMIRDLLVGGHEQTIPYSEASTGAADDLVKATDIARDMAVRFGMTAELGQVAYEQDQAPFLGLPATSWRPRTYGDGTAEAIDHAVKLLVDQAFDHAASVLQRNRKLLDSGAADLLAKETLSKEDIARIATSVTPEAAAQTAAEAA